MTLELKAFIEFRRQGRPLLGIDLGDKTLGLALSDRRWKIASPYQTLPRQKLKQDIQHLRNIIEQEEVIGLVVGLPLNMNATEGERVQKTRQFVRNLEYAVEWPIAFWDERLSTFAVERVLQEGAMPRRRQKEVVDKMAASFILQGALDYMAHQAPITP